MDTIPPPGSGENDPHREERILKLGYFAMLSERYPLNTEVPACSTPESAFFLALEKEYMNIPPELHFDALKDNIPEEHRERIQKIWNVVKEKQARWKTIARVLKTKWNYTPESGDEIANDIVSKTRMTIKDQLKAAAAILINKEPMPSNDSEELSQVQLWQMEEKGLREQFYHADKNYLVALRLYYEMLLEKPKDSQIVKAVLPEDHAQRWNIVFRNRYARMIDAAHQAVTLAKAAHHSQRDKRMRKTLEEPFIYHPLAVTLRFIQDVIPYVVEQRKLPTDFIKGIIITAVHDLAEDTDLTIQDIIEFLQTRADKYDSSLDQVIESGFGLSREEVKRKYLDLMRPHVLDTVRLALRMVTNDAEFYEHEINFALDGNCLGEQRTREVLGIPQKSGLKGLFQRLGSATVPLRTVREFPIEEGGINPKDQKKMDALLLRIETFGRIGKKTPAGEKTMKNRRIALCAKMGDRGHNLSQLSGRQPEAQRSYIRVTVSRLLAYAVLDYDPSKTSLYNALPRLIEETILVYERFFKEFPDHIEEIDRKYYQKLQTWQKVDRSWNPTPLLSRTLDEWNRARNNPA